MSRTHQVVLLLSTLLASWLGMQAVHELGHVLGALATGCAVERVVLHPLTLSRTDLSLNPHPLFVSWAGPVFGAAFPLGVWAAVAATRWSGQFLWRFFAGFCLVANGGYIGGGSFDGIGDCGDLLRAGAPIWSLWLFGLATLPVGMCLWHGQGQSFGLGSQPRKIDGRTAYLMSLLCATIVAVELIAF